MEAATQIIEGQRKDDRYDCESLDSDCMRSKLKDRDEDIKWLIDRRHNVED